MKHALRWGSAVAFTAVALGVPTAEAGCREALTTDLCAAIYRHTSQAAPIVPSGNARSGFDWGDAGIGAGVAIGSVLLVGGTVVTSRRRHRLQIS